MHEIVNTLHLLVSDSLLIVRGKGIQHEMA